MRSISGKQKVLALQIILITLQDIRQRIGVLQSIRENFPTLPDEPTPEILESIVGASAVDQAGRAP